MKEYITVKTNVVGMYLTNGRTIEHYVNNNKWHCLEDMPFLPVLRYISISPSNQVTLASVKGVKHDIDTHNSNFDLGKYSKEVMDNNKIDITTNDLLLGPVSFVFNFTGTPLTITSAYGIAKTFSPLTLKGLPDVEGKLLFMSIHTLNTPQSVEYKHGTNNTYLTHMRDKFVNKKDFRSVEIREVYDYMIKVLATSGAQPTSIISDTYKVATMTAVDVNAKFEDKYFKDRNLNTLSVTNLGVDISRSGMVEVPLHDALVEDFVHDPKVMTTVREHGYSCFIVDNQKQLSPRFFNFAGSTQVIPNIEDVHRLDGFYLMHVDANKKVEPLVFVPIADIDKLEYIYDNQEMARKGADVVELRKEEVEQLKTERTASSLIESAEHTRLLQEINRQHTEKMNAIAEDRARNDTRRAEERSAFELKVLRDKAATDAEIQKLKAQLETKKQETDLSKFQFDQGRYRMDYQNLNMKQTYEEGKYERDSTIETIKTAGAVAGLLAGGYVLFSKFK